MVNRGACEINMKLDIDGLIAHLAEKCPWVNSDTNYIEGPLDQIIEHLKRELSELKLSDFIE